MLGRCFNTTIIAPLTGFSRPLGIHRVNLKSVLMALMTVELNAPRREHLEAVNLIAL